MHLAAEIKTSQSEKIYVGLCVYVCVCEREREREREKEREREYICMWMYLCVSVYVCMCVKIWVCVRAYVYVLWKSVLCVYECVCVRMRARLPVCEWMCCVIDSWMLSLFISTSLNSWFWVQNGEFDCNTNQNRWLNRSNSINIINK